MTYKQLLRDPRWQKKRLKIFERDHWTCQRCGATTRELQVHHLAYVGAPWEAPDHCLQTFCAPCHAEASLSTGHGQLTGIDPRFAEVLRQIQINLVPFREEEERLMARFEILKKRFLSRKEDPDAPA